MNILSINNFKILPQKFNSNENTTMPSRMGLTVAKPLLKDTVSFGHAQTKMVDVLEHQAEKDMARLKRMATVYLDILESVAKKLESLGLTFNRKYCEKNPVKSPSSQVSKMKRSKTLVIPDKLRATYFLKDISNLEILNNHILPELGQRDLILAKTEGDLEKLIPQGYVPTMDEISGKKEVLVPDLDIRLADVSDQIKKLDQELIYSVGKPQSSGYEDIQMRFVRAYDDKQTPDMHELIILTGMNYAFSKHLESEYVYNPIIKEFSELEITKKASETNPDYKAIKLNIDLIKQILKTEISEKLFSNAKKLDCTDKKDCASIKISEETQQRLDEAFNNLEKLLASYYRNAKKSKKIVDTTKKRLDKEFKSDKQALTEIRKSLNEAIQFFNEKDYLKRRKDFWPELFGEKFQAN